MLGSSKPLASLSSGLLARKGQARPAMRPQGFHGTGMNLDDLGWNDMGDHDEPAPLVSIAASAAPIAPQVTIVPPVLVERETLRDAIEPEPVIEPEAVRDVAPVLLEAPAKAVSVATAARIDREVRASESKAAFTLRLDADRHLRLRLASATRNRSAQALVIDALDAFIATLPEVEGLATQLAVSKTSGGRTS